jgi:hypothetical protein
VSSRPGVECSDGYTALLRLLWAASAPARAHVPAKLSRSVPDEYVVDVDPRLRPALHAFLSGTSARLLAQLPGPVEPYLAPALARDLASARAFHDAGPRAVRRLRLRAGRPPGPVTRELITSILADELRRFGRDGCR